jgi:hypothetical protein
MPAKCPRCHKGDLLPDDTGPTCLLCSYHIYTIPDCELAALPVSSEPGFLINASGRERHTHSGGVLDTLNTGVEEDGEL